MDADIGNGAARLLLGDCLERLKGLPDCSVDAVVCDPPYGLAFMGKRWDYDVPSQEVLAECLRVLKPGGHLLAFAGTRTQHRMAVRIEDAGFEIRDMIAWVYGSGFPKSLDVSKAIDKQAGRIGASVIDLKQRLIALADATGMTRAAIDAACGFRATNYLTLPADGKKHDPWVSCLPPREKWAIMKRVLGADDSLDEFFTHAEREVVGVRQVVPGVAFSNDGPTELNVTAPATDAARQWQGWGTALKPALEPITVARKPLIGTVSENVLAHGTGAINVDGCRVPTAGEQDEADYREKCASVVGLGSNRNGNAYGEWTGERQDSASPMGRWPANLCHDGSEEVVSLFPQSNGAGGSVPNVKVTGYGDGIGTGKSEYFGGERKAFESGSGSAARFFYCAKASRKDRNEGCEGMPRKLGPEAGGVRNLEAGKTGGYGAPRENHHPTVKPTDLMRYLCRLVTPPGGTVLDPFMGSGSTGKAAVREGFKFIGCELSSEYLAIAQARIEHAWRKANPEPIEDAPEVGQLALFG